MHPLQPSHWWLISTKGHMFYLCIVGWDILWVPLAQSYFGKKVKLLPSRAPACWVTLWRHWREMLQPKPTPPSSFFFLLRFLFTCFLRYPFPFLPHLFQTFPPSGCFGPWSVRCNMKQHYHNCCWTWKCQDGTFQQRPQSDSRWWHRDAWDVVPWRGQLHNWRAREEAIRGWCPRYPPPPPPVLSSPPSPLPQNTVELSHISLLSGHIDRKSTEWFFKFCGYKLDCEVQSIYSIPQTIINLSPQYNSMF